MTGNLAKFSTLPLKRLVRPISPGAVSIKGHLKDLPDEEGFPAYSASGQDVRVPAPQFNGEGLVLSAVGERCGKCFYASGSWGVVANTRVLFPTKLADARYLFYLVNQQGFWEIDGTAQPYVRMSTSMSQTVPAPPLTTQRRIAWFLDEKTAWIDELIEKKRALLDLLAEKRQALIARAVTKGVEPDAPMKPSGVDWLGDIPMHWDILPMNRVIRMRSGDFLAASDINTDSKHLVFGGNGIRGTTDNFNTIGPIVLVGRQGAHCGNIQLAYGKIWVSEHALRCFPDKQFEVRWLAYMLDMLKLNRYSVSAAQPGLSVDNIQHLQVAFPPLSAQLNIAEHLDENCNRIEGIVRETRRSLRLLEEYRSALITAAVTGQLGKLQ